MAAASLPLPLGIIKSIVKIKLLLTLIFVAAPVFAGDYDYAVFMIAKEAQVKGQRTGTCLLHKQEMIQKRVPVVFGYNDVAKDDPIPYDTRVRVFPHAREFSVNARAGEKGVPTKATVFVCSKCQEAEMK